jgi:hypothetical protein
MVEAGLRFATAPNVSARDSFKGEQRWEGSTTASGRRNRPPPLLWPWPRSRQAAPLVTIPLAAASASRCLLSGPNRCLCKHFHDDGVAAVPAPGLAPKRDWCADRRASRDYRRGSGLEIGEDQVALPTGQETCIGLTAVPAAERGAMRVARDAFPLFAGVAIDRHPHVAAARLNQQQASSVEGDWAQIARLA